jgi:hypothetical protein
VAALKATAAMACLGVLGRVALAVLETAGRAMPEANSRLDVSVSVAADETTGGDR